MGLQVHRPLGGQSKVATLVTTRSGPWHRHCCPREV